MASADSATQANDASKVSSPFSDANDLIPRDVTAVKTLHSSSPHFMTPTLASRRSEVEKSRTRAITPVSIKSIRADGGHSLLKSAAKRVGLRVRDGTPRGRKDGGLKHNGGLPFADMVHELSTHKAELANPSTAFCAFGLKDT